MDDNTIDLTALDTKAATFTFTDKTPEQRTWRVDADLPGRFLKILFADGMKWERGDFSPDVYDGMYTALWHVLRRSQPCTLDEVIDTFSVRDISVIMGELFTRLGFSPAAPAPKTETVIPPAETTLSTSRQRRRASARKSAAAS